MLEMLFEKKYTITILPHPVLCPSGGIIKAKEGKSLAETLVDSGIETSHSCQFQCSCTTCHINVMEGQEYVSPMTCEEEAMLAKSDHRIQWSRLGCQSVFQGGGDVVIEIVE